MRRRQNRNFGYESWQRWCARVKTGLKNSYALVTTAGAVNKIARFQGAKQSRRHTAFQVYGSCKLEGPWNRHVLLGASTAGRRPTFCQLNTNRDVMPHRAALLHVRPGEASRYLFQPSKQLLRGSCRRIDVIGSTDAFPTHVLNQIHGVVDAGCFA
jgi:hypothetical protein